MNGLHEVEVLVFVVFAKRKPFKCTLCRFLLNIYGRKTPKYKKKPVFSHYTSERVLTYEEIDEFKLTFDGIVMRKDDVCAPENSECQSSEMSGHGL